MAQLAFEQEGMVSLFVSYVWCTTSLMFHEVYTAAPAMGEDPAGATTGGPEMPHVWKADAL